MLLALAVAAAIPAPPKPPGVANPASVACVKADGTSKIVTQADGGQIGICIRPDKTQCEEWALYRDRVCVLPPGLEGR